jgi:hypothetical protein
MGKNMTNTFMVIMPEISIPDEKLSEFKVYSKTNTFFCNAANYNEVRNKFPQAMQIKKIDNDKKRRSQRQK